MAKRHAPTTAWKQNSSSLAREAARSRRWACRKVCERAENRADWVGLRTGVPSCGPRETRPHPANLTAMFKLCDMCGRPLWRKKNFLDWHSPRSGADMCAAFDAAHTPQARMGVRGSGPNQAHALEAPVSMVHGSWVGPH